MSETRKMYEIGFNSEGVFYYLQASIDKDFKLCAEDTIPGTGSLIDKIEDNILLAKRVIQCKDSKNG